MREPEHYILVDAKDNVLARCSKYTLENTLLTFTNPDEANEPEKSIYKDIIPQEPITVLAIIGKWNVNER